MSQSTPSWRDIKTNLTGMNANSLISLIHDLYALNKENKEYLQGRVGGEAAYASLRENAAKKIRHEFFPERGYGKARIASVKKAIQGYKKARGESEEPLNANLQYIEQFVKLCREYGGEEQSKLDALSIAMKELLKILETCPAIIEVLNIEERLYAAKKDASYFGFGIEDKIFDLIVDIEALE